MRKKMMQGRVEKKTINAEELIYHIGENVRLYGSIYKIRKMKEFAFVLLRTRREILQCVYSDGMADFLLDELKEESTVMITAHVVAEERSRSGYELQLLEAEILSEPAKASPIVINNKLVDTSLENLLVYCIIKM